MLNVNERAARPAEDRCVRFEAAYNFRDLGGYRCNDGRRLRWRRLYRSGALQWMTQGDAHKAREVLGVRSVIDLRNSEEVQRDGCAPFLQHPVRYFHVPILDGERRASQQAQERPDFDMSRLYLRMLRDGANDFARAVRMVVAHAHEPIVFHCAAGKDRTGLLAAILLGAFGVSDDDIIDDYALTSRHLDPIIERMRSTPGYAEIVGDLPADIFSSRPEAMARTLEGVRARWGSMRDYLASIGLDEAELAGIEESVLE
ncbi:MAG: tyrosine-protein phosphatase [Chloroflexi bacterium]|nr:tyrosine-protein phosphatase [Chloroflexota bacterium]